jgi:hypothetical protein
MREWGRDGRLRYGGTEKECIRQLTDTEDRRTPRTSARFVAKNLRMNRDRLAVVAEQQNHPAGCLIGSRFLPGH